MKIENILTKRASPECISRGSDFLFEKNLSGTMQRTHLARCQRLAMSSTGHVPPAKEWTAQPTSDNRGHKTEI